MDIYCFGDSHTRYFKRANTLSWSGILTHTTPQVFAFDFVAASAKGIAAGDGSRFAFRSFHREFMASKPEYVCMGYGQVDAEMGYHYRRYVKGYTGTAEADLSAVYDSYIHMVEATVPLRPIVFKGPNPSTLRSDPQLLRNVYLRLVARITATDERAAIWADMQERPPAVADHAQVNQMAAQMLKAKVEQAGHIYFDIRDAVEDPEVPGMARWEFVPANSDVHLVDSFHVRKVHFERLFAAFEGIDVRHID